MVSVAQLGPSVDLRPMFAGQRSNLIELLTGLSTTDWERETVCDGWTVADVVAHLVGNMLGRVGGLRGEPSRNSIGQSETLAEGVDRLNAEWVRGSRLLSPGVVVQMLETFGPQHDDLWARRPLDAPSLGVSWAGMDPAPTWLDAAREVTEYWVHDRQLRDAIGDGGSSGPGLQVILDVFARGLPHTLDHHGPEGGSSFVLTADPPAISWLLHRRSDGHWYLDHHEPAATPDAALTLDGEELWRRWTRQPRGQGSLDSAALPWPLHVVAAHVAIIHSDP